MLSRNWKGWVRQERCQTSQQWGKGLRILSPRLCSRCSNWSLPPLFPQILPHSIRGSKSGQLDLQLYFDMTPPLQPHHWELVSSFSSLQWQPHAIHAAAWVSKLSPACVFLISPGSHSRLWDTVQRVGVWVRWPVFNLDSAPTCCATWLASILPPTTLSSAVPASLPSGSVPASLRVSPPYLFLSYLSPPCLFMSPFICNTQS